MRYFRICNKKLGLPLKKIEVVIPSSWSTLYIFIQLVSERFYEKRSISFQIELCVTLGTHCRCIRRTTIQVGDGGYVKKIIFRREYIKIEHKICKQITIFKNYSFYALKLGPILFIIRTSTKLHIHKGILILLKLIFYAHPPSPTRIQFCQIWMFFINYWLVNIWENN